MKIAQENPSRGIVLLLSGLDAGDVPANLLPYLCDNEWATVRQRVSGLLDSSQLVLGDGPYDPTALFERLPVTGDEWRFMPHGPTDDAKRRVYELYVREYMVLILKGADLSLVELNWPMLVSEAYKSEALAEARDLVAADVSPYSERREGGRGFPVGAPPRDERERNYESEESQTAVRHVYDADRTSCAKSWYDRVDYGGRGYPQDMEFVCCACGHREGLVSPNEAPDACPRCGVRERQHDRS